jgi:excisionase family DNA binding protein
MSAVREDHLPSPSEQDAARHALRALSGLGPDRMVRVSGDGDDQRVEVVLPQRVFEDLLELLRQTAEGNAVTMVPIHAELTTQQAADLLNVSRPHLIKLLEDGEIPHHRTGRHRRIRAEDLFAYRERRHQESQEALQALADLSQEHDLGY